MVRKGFLKNSKFSKKKSDLSEKFRFLLKNQKFPDNPFFAQIIQKCPKIQNFPKIQKNKIIPKSSNL